MSEFKRSIEIGGWVMFILQFFVSGGAGILMGLIAIALLSMAIEMKLGDVGIRK